MKEGKNISVKEVVNVIILTLINIALTYGYQCLILMFDFGRETARKGEIMIFLCGAPMLVIQGLFAWMGKRLTQYDTGAICRIMISTMILYISSMFLLFPLLPVPYNLIPSGEMAFGFFQFLIQVFTSIAAFLCAAISGIALFLNKNS